MRTLLRDFFLLVRAIALLILSVLGIMACSGATSPTVQTTVLFSNKLWEAVTVERAGAPADLVPPTYTRCYQLHDGDGSFNVSASDFSTIHRTYAAGAHAALVLQTAPAGRPNVATVDSLTPGACAP